MRENNMPLCRFTVHVDDPMQCPFGPEEIPITLHPGATVWLKGPSGVGKTTLVQGLLGLREIPGAHIQWNSEIDASEIGYLFQEGVLLDEYSVLDNLHMACTDAAMARDGIIQSLVRMGLCAQDAYRMPSELSGGMRRRVALLQILLQKKKFMILDEPFVGLDQETAYQIIDVVKDIAKTYGIGFLLIAHEPHYAKALMGGEVHEVVLEKTLTLEARSKEHSSHSWGMFARFFRAWNDYLWLSLPVLILGFMASALAFGILFLQMLHKLDIQSLLNQFQHHGPFSIWESIKMHFIDKEINMVSAHYLPLLKMKLYVLVMVRGFVGQIMPLLAALLLAGRIGASYAGNVAMLQATSQNDLLTLLGFSPRSWTFVPAMVAMMLVVPILILLSALVSIFMAYLAVHYIQPTWFVSFGNFYHMVRYDLQGDIFQNALFIAVYRMEVFGLVVVGIAEYVGRFRAHISPRNVPKIITFAVVMSSLAIIICDWVLTELVM